MVMRRSGAPDNVSFTSQMLWLSADIFACEMPSVDSPEAAIDQWTMPTVVGAVDFVALASATVMVNRSPPLLPPDAAPPDPPRAPPAVPPAPMPAAPVAPPLPAAPVLPPRPDPAAPVV